MLYSRHWEIEILFLLMCTDLVFFVVNFVQVRSCMKFLLPTWCQTIHVMCFYAEIRLEILKKSTLIRRSILHWYVSSVDHLCYSVIVDSIWHSQPKEMHAQNCNVDLIGSNTILRFGVWGIFARGMDGYKCGYVKLYGSKSS